MTTIKTVALAGANGNLGAPVLQALLDAKFDVTVLSRPESSSTFPAGVKVAKVDYGDIESLSAALKGQDAVIATLGYAAMKTQEKLVDAAIAAGVKRVIPSEFGPDPEVATVRQLPVFADKVQTEQYVKSKVQGTATSYTLICNNEFFDWGLDYKFGIDIQGKKMELFDGGDVAWTTSPLSFVAKGVVGVLQHPAETANRVVRLHGASLTQNKLLELVQRFVGTEGWDITHASTAEREKQGYEGLKSDPSNFFAWAVPFLQVATYGQAFGGDFSKKNDNELLGLKELSDAEVEDIVRNRT